MIFPYITLAPWMRQWVILFMLVASPSWASAIPQFTLSDNIELQSVSTLHWTDTNKVATPSEAKAALVSGGLIVDAFTLPAQNTSHWFAVTLINPTDHTINPSIFLKQAVPNIVNVHYEQQLTNSLQAQWVSLFNGTDIPLQQRSVWALSPTFNLSLAAHQEQTYYIEVHSIVKLFTLDIMIGEAKNSNSFDQAHLSILNLFIGSILTLSIISLLMYVSFRDSLYLYYGAYILSFLFTVVIDNALDLYVELPTSDRSFLYLSYSGAIIFFTLFVGEVLDAKRTMPWFNNVLRVGRVVSVALAGLTLYDFAFFVNTLNIILVYSVLILLYSVLIVGVTLYAAFNGSSSVRLLAYGIVFFLFGVMIARVVNVGLIQSNLATDHAHILGTFVEMVLFLVVLFRRILTINADKHKANSALLKLAHEAKAVLEKTVQERTHEIQKSNHARGEFIATINHEIRTPLNGILGMVEMLQRLPSTTEQEEHLGHLGAASQQLSGLVGDVLDFSKIDEGFVVLHTEDFSIHSLAQNLTGLFSLSAKQKGLDLSVQVEAEVNEWLHGDIPRVKQVLINLISNAIKFTELGEVRVVISAGQSTKDNSEDQGEGQANLIMFEVSDTGFGIEQSQIEHIFTPYYQIEDQLKPSALKVSAVGRSGTGLGLTISQGLVKAMGGSIEVTSQIGRGSAFAFTLSLPPAIFHHKDPSNLESETLDDAGLCFTGINILLVEDSHVNQHLMEAFLEDTGANISTCDTGTSAINHFKDHGADLILMDYRLPDTNGLVATEIIRAYEQQLGSLRCPIVMHTADNRISLRTEAETVGIDQLLPKPFTREQLINAISLGLGISHSSACPPLRLNANSIFIPLLGEFLDSTLASIQLCKDSLTLGDVRALRNELHKCKGSSGLYGADELYQTVSDIQEELVAAPYDMDAISTLLTLAERQLKGYHFGQRGLQ